MGRSHWLGSVVLALGAAATVACSDGSVEPLSPDEALLASTGPVLIECPVEEETYAVGQVGATGGSVRLDRHELSVPAQAVTSPKEFRVGAPVSNYMELSVHAGGQASFQFRKTATITIDYSRCTRDNIDKAPLSVWQIDPDTKALIEYMGGVDDKEARTITFQTDHLSTFSIAR